MKAEAYSLLAGRHQTYWWHRARRSTSLAVLRRFGLNERCRWLDVGCGPGGNLMLLEALRPELIAGLDLSPIALKLAQKSSPGARLVRADISQGLPFAAAAFDVVTIFNVLYHRWIPSEDAVLHEVIRVLRPGGLLLITEPAFSILEREMDEIGMGLRRYRVADIAGFCRTAGFQVEFASYFTAFGFPLLLAAKLFSDLRRRWGTPVAGQASDMKPLPKPINEMAYQLARLEGGLIAAGASIPFGVTLLCLARRPLARDSGVY
jgi:SAM-dependent methyltransferase